MKKDDNVIKMTKKPPKIKSENHNKYGKANVKRILEGKKPINYKYEAIRIIMTIIVIVYMLRSIFK